MALMGLLEPVYRLPMVPPSQASLAKIEKVLEAARPAGERASCRLRSSAFSRRSRQTTRDEHFRLFAEFKAALNAGEMRAAEPDASTSTGWRVNAWVKKGILLGFRMGGVVDMSVDRERQPFFDKSPIR